MSFNMACGNKENPVAHAMSQSNGVLVPTATSQIPASDINGIDWMAQQNGGRFDPMLFGDYRDPQDAIINNDFGGFFDEAFLLPDFGSFGSPFTTGDIASPAPKRDLMKEIEDKQNEEVEDVVPVKKTSQLLTCNKIWSVHSVQPVVGSEIADHVRWRRDRLQSNPAYQSGELDVDNLCAELKAKAICSQTGLVVDQKEVDDLLNRMKTR